MRRISNRRRQYLLAAGGMAVAPYAAFGQAPVAPRIGVLDPSPSASTRSRIDQFRIGLKSLGYQEGSGYVLEYRSAEGRFERLPALAAELVRIPVKVIVARNTPGTRAAQDATRSIPIVMADVGDPLALGFVTSLARPGGNVTGLANATLELLRKRLEIVQELVPAVGRVAVLGNADDPNTPYQIAEVQTAAKALRIEVRVFDARSERQLESELEAIAAWHPQAMLLLVHPLLVTMSPRLVRWGADRRLPIIHAFPGEVKAGGLVAYAADLSDQYQKVAVYVDRLLKGARASELPVERPTRFELIVNLGTAKKIGLTVPRSILLRADQVIE